METRDKNINSCTYEKNNKLNAYLKIVLLFLAIINYKNTNICASLLLITSIVTIVEKVKLNRIEKSKYNTMILMSEVLISILCLGCLVIYNI